jgi:hypothetical protein
MCHPVPKEAHDAIRSERRARRRGDGSGRYALVPFGATLSEFAEGNPSEIPSRTQSVSAFLFGKLSMGPRSFGKTLRDLIHPLMGSNRILCSLDAQWKINQPPSLER